MGSESQSITENIVADQSFFEKQVNQSQMAELKRQVRDPLRGYTELHSLSKGTMANIPTCYLSDGFDQENPDLWLKSDWQNVDPAYLNSWLPDPSHIIISQMEICC